MTIELVRNTEGTVIKGKDMSAVTNVYRQVQAGQSFTASGGRKLFLVMESQSNGKASFVFSVQYSLVQGTANSSPNNSKAESVPKPLAIQPEPQSEK